MDNLICGANTKPAQQNSSEYYGQKQNTLLYRTPE